MVKICWKFQLKEWFGTENLRSQVLAAVLHHYKLCFLIRLAHSNLCLKFLTHCHLSYTSTIKIKLNPFEKIHFTPNSYQIQGISKILCHCFSYAETQHYVNLMQKRSSVEDDLQGTHGLHI
jgi:hypothetical protein